MAPTEGRPGSVDPSGRLHTTPIPSTIPVLTELIDYAD